MYIIQDSELRECVREARDGATKRGTPSRIRALFRSKNDTVEVRTVDDVEGIYITIDFH